MQPTEQVAPADRNLMRPKQVEDTKSEMASLEEQLRSPHIEDKGEVHNKLNRVRKSFEQQVPHAPQNPGEEDRMVKRSRQLLSEILDGMPSQEEMRKAPPGAVDKHMKWERRNKAKIVEWKNLQLRLTAGSGDNEVANLERHRPVASSLSMDNAFIPGKQYYLPPEGAALPVTFSNEQLAFLRSKDPVLADMLASLTNRQRAEVKEVIDGLGFAGESTEAQLNGKLGVTKREEKRGRKPMTPEAKALMVERLAKARAAKAAKTKE